MKTAPVSLGIDTGGTYTDAVLYRASDGVLAKAKHVTTREDLMIGIRAVIGKVITESGFDGGSVRLVSLSTTLATNAIVEGHGGRVCLVLIGPLEHALGRSRLEEALGSDPCESIAGGHDALGSPLAELDEAALQRIAEQYRDEVRAFAVAGQFATRNPSHENRARDILAGASGLPVTCSSDLSNQLDAPRRALTTTLNARLIPLIADLLHACRATMEEHGIDAPLMVMQGNGSLLNADNALLRPVETMLSGPAASIVGALALGGARDAVVSDIGGTTTDIALVKDGQPQLARDGSEVAGWRTMVRSVAIHTWGLGGDSEVAIERNGLLLLGPQRAVPLALLASQHPGITAALEAQLKRPPREQDARFALRYRRMPPDYRLTRNEKRLWEALEAGPQPLDTLFADATLERPFERLRRHGWVALAAPTPSDAAHHLGQQHHWPAAASSVGLTVMARRLPNKVDDKILAQQIIDRLVKQSARRIYSSAWQLDGGGVLDDKATAPLLDAAFADDAIAGACSVSLTLRLPLIGIGAPAPTYYPAVAKALGAESMIPEHADVCNAVGAVASGIVRRHHALVLAISDSSFRLQINGELVDYNDPEAAAVDGLERLEALARADAIACGADAIAIEPQREDVIVHGPAGDRLVMEIRLEVAARGQPRVLEQSVS
ncbi:hydantoinase/oxoprolinase family protein [Gammaproteobacteria bacterium]|nr:hydantoinase/oxoprolinase family protein [Gammaproteobacteria bacterium]